MRAARLRAGFWIRLCTAVIVGLCGLGVLLAVEFALTVLGLLVIIAYAPTLGVAIVGIGLAVGAAVLCWWAAVWTFRRVLTPGALSEGITANGVDDLVERIGSVLWTPPGAHRSGPVIAGIAGIGLVLIAVDVLFRDFAGVGLVPLTGTIAATAVAGYTAWLVYGEVSTEGSLHASLDSEYRATRAPTQEAAVRGRLTRLAKQADTPVPEVQVGLSSVPKAATVGYRPAESTLFVSKGLLSTLNDEELDAVLAHELAHLANRDAAVLTALSVPQLKAERVLVNAGLFGLIVGAPVYIITLFSVPVVARYREYVADHAAAELTGDPAALAGALATISDEYRGQGHEDLRSRSSTAAFGIVPPPWRERKLFDRTTRFIRRRIFGTHPPTAKRIERLRSRIE